MPANAQARMNAGAEDDDLVDDPYFAGLLNADRELMIEGINYRITNVGTFSFREDKRAKILKAIQKIQANKGKLPGSASGRQSSEQIQQEFIPIEGGDGGWYPVDPEVTAPPEDLDPINSGALPIPGFPSSPAPFNGCGATLNSRTWSKDFGAYLGGYINDNIMKGWNALRRGKDLKAVVWSENWGIYSSFGIKSVNQHKGWTGIWRRDDADYISWEITNSEIEFKDGLGNPVTFNVNSGDALPNASMVHQLFDLNSAKFKIKVTSGGGTTYIYLPVPATPASTYKVKKMRSCHFVRDEGNLTAQVKLEIN